MVFQSEADAQEKVVALLKEERNIKSVKVLSAGLGSRANFLRELLDRHKQLHLQIVACFGNKSPNPDKLDREKLGPSQFDVITNRLDQDTSARLEVYGSLNTPSFRCVLLSDSHGPRYGIVGWYTYHERNTEIIGRRNPQIFVDRTTELGFALLRFAERIWGNYATAKEANVLWPLGNTRKDQNAE
jgi:hypothetical protein